MAGPTAEQVSELVSSPKASQEALLAEVKALKKSFKDEATETIKDILGSTLGPGFGSVAGILVQALGMGAVQLGANILSSVTGGVAAVNSVVATALLAVPLFPMIIQYKAVKNLKNQ